MMEDLEDQDDYDGGEGDIRDILRNIKAPVDSYKREAREAARRRAEIRGAENIWYFLYALVKLIFIIK